MTDIRLLGLARPSDGTNRERLEQLTGFRLQRDGDDWIIPETDPALCRGPLDVLATTDTPRPLSPRSYQAIAEEYAANFLVSYFEEKMQQPTEKVKIYGDWGARTPFYQHQLNFFLDPTNSVPIRLVQETFPFFVNEHLANAVAPLAINANYQQAFLSISKILALVQYSGLEGAAEHIANQKALSAALPTPLDILSYVESINTMSPSAISLPVHRIASSLHFMRPNPWFFPRLAIENVYEQMLTNIEPLADSGIAFFTKGQHLQTRAIQSYFLTAVESINRLTRYLNDIRSYVDDQGVYDGMKMAKAHSVVRLLFADWQSINFTNSRYIKLRMVFAFLDKLANFISMMKPGTTSEEELFRRLCSAATGNSLAAMLKENFEVRFHSLGRLMAGVVQATYAAIHIHISSQLRKPTCTEYERLSYLRTLRNSAHGAFLKSNQFEQVFLAAGGTICMEFTYLPLLLLWGLVTNPERFIREIRY